jgi:formylglycine-generating enzyme required for sulfatase activity
MECPNCNKPNPGGVVYCKECGKTMLIASDNPAGIEWVKIGAGMFLCSDDIYGGDTPVLERTFTIGKYPVTNAQYKIFLDANPGVSIPQDWNKEKRVYPAGKENHPVAYVSYNGATAFCKWGKYSLPTKSQWEKAARGTDGRTYPWGEDWRDGKYCNSREASIADTTPVDKYPDGASPYGVMDMVGNVDEWCRSSGLNNRTTKMLRGGSFDMFKTGVECVFKYEADPTCSYMPYGFRCVDFLHL